jgi:hypothetical protein
MSGGIMEMEEFTTAVSNLLGMVPLEAQRDVGLPADTGPMWMGRNLARKLVSIQQSTIASIKVILTEVRGQYGSDLPKALERQLKEIEQLEDKRLTNLLDDMLEVVSTCDELPAAGPAWAHARREFSDAIREWEQDREIIAQVEQLLTEVQESYGWIAPFNLDQALDRIEHLLEEVHYKRTEKVQRQIVRLWQIVRLPQPSK